MALILLNFLLNVAHSTGLRRRPTQVSLVDDIEAAVREAREERQETVSGAERNGTRDGSVRGGVDEDAGERENEYLEEREDEPPVVRFPHRTGTETSGLTINDTGDTSEVRLWHIIVSHLLA
jgi:hypothetical protein